MGLTVDLIIGLLHILFTLLLKALPYAVAGVLFAALVTVIFRRDLVEQALTSGLSLKDKLNAGPYWTDGSESLPEFKVPPVVQMQMMANRVKRFRTDRLESLGKRLDKIEKELKKSVREGRMSRLAYKFEQLEVLAGLERSESETTTTAVNTDHVKPKRKRPRTPAKSEESLGDLGRELIDSVISLRTKVTDIIGFGRSVAMWVYRVVSSLLNIELWRKISVFFDSYVASIPRKFMNFLVQRNSDGTTEVTVTLLPDTEHLDATNVVQSTSDQIRSDGS